MDWFSYPWFLNHNKQLRSVANVKLQYPFNPRSSFSLLIDSPGIYSPSIPLGRGLEMRHSRHSGQLTQGQLRHTGTSAVTRLIQEMMRVLRKINTIYTGEEKLFQSFDTCLGWGRTRVLLGVWRERLLMKWWLSVSELWDQRHQWKLEICKLWRRYTDMTRQPCSALQ